MILKLNNILTTLTPVIIVFEFMMKTFKWYERKNTTK